jgi:serine/threonine protein kinase
MGTLQSYTQQLHADNNDD